MSPCFPCPPPHRLAKGRESGFTRLECVALIIALGLMALAIVPSLGRTQTRSELAGCVSNQQRLIQAFLLYAAENQDAWVGSSWTPTNTPIELVAGGFWAGSTRPINQQINADTALLAVRDGLANGPLWAYAPDAEVVHCPGDRRWWNLRPGSGWGWDSYAKSETIGTGTFGGVKPFRKVAEVRDPGRTALLIEQTDPRGYNQGTWTMAINPPGWVDVLSAMHEDAGMFGFVDGHAEARRWADAAVLKAARESMRGQQSFFFPGGNARNPDFVWVWDRYQHLGWKALP